MKYQESKTLKYSLSLFLALTMICLSSTVFAEDEYGDDEFEAQEEVVTERTEKTSEASPKKSESVEQKDTRPNEPPYTNVEEADLTKPRVQQTQQDPAAEEIPVPTVSNPKEHKIAHPNAAKGLYLIDRTTGKYYYKVDTVTKRESIMSLRVGTYETPQITATTSTGEIGFADVYGDESPVFLMYDYEWAPFKKMPNLNVQLGVGFFMVQGNGVLETSTEGPKEAKERYTMIALPLNLGLALRFQFSPKQWLVPYVAGGGTYFGLIETRDDGKDTAAVGSPAAYGAGGFLFNLSAFDKQAAFIFDREYGINNFWLTGEFRVYQSFSDDVDMSSNVINFGVTVDY